MTWAASMAGKQACQARRILAQLSRELCEMRKDRSSRQTKSAPSMSAGLTLETIRQAI